jgi:cell division cycle 14
MCKMLFHSVVGDRVYLAENRARTNRMDENLHFFSTDDRFTYVPFCDDFGPMNLHCVIQFVDLLQQKLDELPDKTLVYCVENFPRTITNAVFLLGCYMVIRMRLSPDVVWSAFDDLSDRITSYRDATFEKPSFHLTLIDCWRGLQRANTIGWVDMYDLDEYLHYDSPLEGDLHELVPGKLVAFRGPRSLPLFQDYQDDNGVRTFSPGFYLEPFGDMSVSVVVRLNEPEYEAREFEAHGIATVDLEFEDCTAPPLDVMAAFMDVMRSAPGAVAVHCKAGLGRTGTLAAMYLMATHGFAAREAMGWLRIVRPGSVIGDQQHFLCDIEDIHLEQVAAEDRTQQVERSELETADVQVGFEGAASMCQCSPTHFRPPRPDRDSAAAPALHSIAAGDDTAVGSTPLSTIPENADADFHDLLPRFGPGQTPATSSVAVATCGTYDRGADAGPSGVDRVLGSGGSGRHEAVAGQIAAAVGSKGRVQAKLRQCRAAAAILTPLLGEAGLA